MKISILKQGDHTAYDDFVASQKGSVVQSWGWGEFQKTIPSRGKFWALGAKEGDKWLGSALVVRQRLPLGLCWFSIARGPIIATDKGQEWKVWEGLLATLKGLAKQEKAVFVRVEPTLNCVLDFKELGLRQAHAHYQPEWSLRVDLTLSEEDILKQMKPKGRYNIKVATKAGVTVRMTHDPNDVIKFYEVLKKTGGRDGFSIHEQAYYERFVARGHKEGWGELFVAEIDGKVIGGLLATFFGDTATYYYGASDHAHRSSMAPYLTQWAAIQEGKRRGCHWYDFLGIAPPDKPKHVWAGITQFKTKFGGERIQYPQAHEYVFKGFWYGVMLLRKRLKF